MTLRLLTPPTIEPVTLAEAKLHLRVDHDDEDSLITRLISAARSRAETIMQRAILTQTWERVLDQFPAGGIELGMAPVQSVTLVRYINAAGTLATVDSSLYTVDDVQGRGWVVPTDASGGWPETAETVNAVRVQFVSGWTDASFVPAEVKHFVLMHVTSMYDRRDAISDVGNNVAALPFVDRLLDPWRVY